MSKTMAASARTMSARESRRIGASLMPGGQVRRRRRRRRRSTSVSRPPATLDGMTTRRVIVDHVLFVVSDLEASRRFYTAALAPLGLEELHVQADGVGYGAGGLDDFTIDV